MTFQRKIKWNHANENTSESKSEDQALIVESKSDWEPNKKPSYDLDVYWGN